MYDIPRGAMLESCAQYFFFFYDSIHQQLLVIIIQIIESIIATLRPTVRFPFVQECGKAIFKIES